LAIAKDDGLSSATLTQARQRQAAFPSHPRHSL